MKWDHRNAKSDSLTMADYAAGAIFAGVGAALAHNTRRPNSVALLWARVVVVVVAVDDSDFVSRSWSRACSRNC